MVNYLVLFSLAKPNLQSARRVEGALQKLDTAAKAVWFDAAYVGYVLTTNLSARDVAVAAFANAEDFRDTLIVEIGAQWWARPDSPAYHWLTTRWFNHPDAPD